MKRRPQFLIALLLGGLAGGLFGGQAHAQEPADDVEVILAFDSSGSMRHAIEAAKAAANEFVLAMPADVRKVVDDFKPSGLVQGEAKLLREPKLNPGDDDRGRARRGLRRRARHGARD